MHREERTVGGGCTPLLVEITAAAPGTRIRPTTNAAMQARMPETAANSRLTIVVREGPP